MVSDLSSESLELTTMPESLLLPQSRVSGFSAGGDLLSMIRGEATGWVGMDGGGWCDAGANAGTGRFGLVVVVEVALEATDADRTSLGTGADGGTSLGGLVDSTGVMEIEGLFSCTGTSLGGSLVEMGLIGGGGLAVVVAVPDAMMIFWLLSVFMMGLLVVE